MVESNSIYIHPLACCTSHQTSRSSDHTSPLLTTHQHKSRSSNPFSRRERNKKVWWVKQCVPQKVRDEGKKEKGRFLCWWGLDEGVVFDNRVMCFCSYLNVVVFYLSAFSSWVEPAVIQDGTSNPDNSCFMDKSFSPPNRRHWRRLSRKQGQPSSSRASSNWAVTCSVKEKGVPRGRRGWLLLSVLVDFVVCFDCMCREGEQERQDHQWLGLLGGLSER